MYIRAFVCNAFAENTYLLYDEASSDAVLVDCGCVSVAEFLPIRDFILSHRLTLRRMLCTHVHPDHIIGTPFVYETFGLRPEASCAEIPFYESLSSSPAMQSIFSALGVDMDKKDADSTHFKLPPLLPSYLSEGDEIPLGDTVFRVLSLPGHSAGSLGFYAPSERVCLVGDTIFRLSVGRTDFPGGDAAQLARSIREVLFALPPATVLLSGHGPSTTVTFERTHNPYVRPD